MLGIHRMLLHAERVGFDHPQTGERLVVDTPPGDEFAKALLLFPGTATV